MTDQVKDETWRPMGVDLWLWTGWEGDWTLGVHSNFERLDVLGWAPAHRADPDAPATVWRRRLQPPLLGLLGPGWEDLTEWEIGWLEVDGGYGDDGTEVRETMHVLAGHDDVDAALDIAVILGCMRHKADVLAVRHQVCGAIVNRVSAPSLHCTDCAAVAERARDRLGWA